MDPNEKNVSSWLCKVFFPEDDVANDTMDVFRAPTMVTDTTTSVDMSMTLLDASATNGEYSVMVVPSKLFQLEVMIQWTCSDPCKDLFLIVSFACFASPPF